LLASEPIPENKEILIVRLSLNSDEVNNIDVMHVLNTEYRDARKNLIDECKSEKYTIYELEVLAIEKMQQNDVDINRIFYFAEAREIDRYIARGDISF